VDSGEGIVRQRASCVAWRGVAWRGVDGQPAGKETTHTFLLFHSTQGFWDRLWREQLQGNLVRWQ